MHFCLIFLSDYLSGYLKAKGKLVEVTGCVDLPVPPGGHTSSPPRSTPPPHSAPPPCSTPRSTPPSAPPPHCSSPTTLLPHTTPPLHHTSPSPCVWWFRSETASTLLCWCNRTSKSEGSGSLTTAGSTWGLVGRVLQDLEQANGLGLCGSRNPRQLAAKRPAGGSWV